MPSMVSRISGSNTVVPASRGIAPKIPARKTIQPIGTPMQVTSRALEAPAPPKKKPDRKPATAPAAARPKHHERRDLAKSQARLEKQVARAEAEIGGLEARIRRRTEELADPALYQDFSRWNELHLEQEQWSRDLDRLTARWADLSQELEGVRKRLEVLD